MHVVIVCLIVVCRHIRNVFSISCTESIYLRNSNFLAKMSQYSFIVNWPYIPLAQIYKKKKLFQSFHLNIANIYIKKNLSNLI